MKTLYKTLQQVLFIPYFLRNSFECPKVDFLRSITSHCLKQSDERYAAYKAEIEKLRIKLDRMTQQMQKAFMRGVCALNYEARTVFNEGEQVINGSEEVVQITRNCSENTKCCNVASTKNNLFSGNTTPRCCAPFVPQTESGLFLCLMKFLLNLM